MAKRMYKEKALRAHRNAVYSDILKNKPEITRGPRLIFEQDYLKNSRKPEEIKNAVEKFIKDYKEFRVESVMKWAYEKIKKAENPTIQVGDNNDDER